MHHTAIVLSGLLSLSCSATLHAQCTPDPLPFPSPINGVQLISEHQGQLVVGGDRAATKNLASWDGSQWVPFGNGPGRVVNDVITFQGDLYACGSFPSKVSRWNGTTWQQVGAFPSASISTRRFAIYRDELIVAGKFTTVGGKACNNIARWDGSAWQPLGTGVNKEVIDIIIYNDELIASGYFTEASGQPIAHIARWNGTSWNSLGGGLDSWASALEVHNGDLYAGGLFQTAGGQPAPLIARFDGADWHDVGGGLTGTQPQNFVTAIKSYRGQLLVSGLFRSAGGVPVNYFARWTGAEWLAMGSFTNFPYVISVYDGDVYTGGLTVNLARFGCPPCAADLDGDGYVDFVDYLTYSDLHAAGDLEADLNGDGLVDSADWLVFFDAYAMGC